jgi:pSer/pThr/pTyr-binding forkhead associated (FHA) protein
MNDQERALQLFRRSCGLDAPIQLECEDSSRPTAERVVSVFECPFVVIGRGSRSDLQLDHGDVSRRHAFLQALAGELFIVDLQSRSKVQWEGEETSRSHGWLDENRFIQVGPYRLRTRGRRVTDDPRGRLPVRGSALLAETYNSDALPRAGLELPIRVGQQPSQWFLESGLALVGRAEECQLVLTDESISKFHAAVVRTPLGVWVVDLSTREGSHVNGQRVRWAWLGDGDSLRLGRFTFVMRYESAIEGISRIDVPLGAGADLAVRPGTDLAVRAVNSGHKPTGLAVRTGGRAQTEPNASAMNRHQAVIPSALLASNNATWEPAIIPPAMPMALWEQQMRMMELFHNEMMMMFQMFVAMRGEHLASVRHELGRVEQLTRELSELQNRLTQPAGSVGAGGTAGAPAQSPKRAPTSSPVRKKTDPRQASRESNHAADRTGHRPRSAAPSNGQPRSAADPSPAHCERAGPTDDVQIHELLTKRIAELQRERQGYWQKILSVLNN